MPSCSISAPAPPSAPWSPARSARFPPASGNTGSTAHARCWAAPRATAASSSPGCATSCADSRATIPMTPLPTCRPTAIASRCFPFLAGERSPGWERLRPRHHPRRAPQHPARRPAAGRHGSCRLSAGGHLRPARPGHRRTPRRPRVGRGAPALRSLDPDSCRRPRPPRHPLRRRRTHQPRRRHLGHCRR